MLALIIYLLSIFIVLLFLFIMIIYTLSLLYSSWMGSPYVPSKQKEIDFFLGEAGLKPGSLFLELGCGDARVIRTAVSKYKTRGVGIDINPLIIRWAQFLSKITKVNGIAYKTQNIFKADVSNADYIYLFLMPDLIRKLEPKLKNEIKATCIVISHGFKVEAWERFLYKKIPHSPFPTYFYRIEAPMSLRSEKLIGSGNLAEAKAG